VRIITSPAVVKPAMKVFLEKNGEDNGVVVAYIAYVEIATTPPDLNATFHGPVYLQHLLNL